jgi:3-mercaptopropionate dioxygenase
MTLHERVACPALAELITAVSATFELPSSDSQRAERVAGALQPFLGRADLLAPEQCEADPTRYRQHILHVDPDERFSIVALVWLPGQTTPIHDHIAWCVFGVHEGEEYEIRYRLCQCDDGYQLLPIGGSTSARGQVEALVPPGDIHHVYNRGRGRAISIHVYGASVANCGTSVRRRYELPILPSMEELAALPSRCTPPIEPHLHTTCV